MTCEKSLYTSKELYDGFTVTIVSAEQSPSCNSMECEKTMRTLQQTGLLSWFKNSLKEEISPWDEQQR